jgi:tetratricopeptide (TPR) repeat protein
MSAPGRGHGSRAPAVTLALAAALVLAAWPNDADAAPAARPARRPSRAAAPVAAAAVPRAHAPARDPWREARGMADRGQPDSALALLRTRLDREPRAFGLRWLEAGVTGEAGRHAEAVALYERLADEFPERADELLADLARERLRAGDARGAIRDLDRWLAAHPDDRDARRRQAQAFVEADSLTGALAAWDALLEREPADTESALERAQVLGWMGRHRAAIAAYRAVLERDPGSAEAELGLARNESWSGRNRRSARRLEALTGRGEGGAEAWKALAFARYWDEDPDGAQAALARHRALAPDDREAVELSQRIARESRSSLELGHGRSSDSDGLNVSSPSLELSFPLAPRTGASLAWSHVIAEDGGGTSRATVWSAGVRTRWSPVWTTAARGAVTSWDSTGGARLGGELGVVARPADLLRLELVAAREPLTTRLALSETVTLLGWTLAADLQVAPRLSLHADGRAGSYSDGNRSERTSFSATWRAMDTRAWDLALLLALDQLNVREDLDHGYYDPDFHREWGPGVELEHRPGARWRIGAGARTGWQREKGGPADPFYGLSGRLRWLPDPDWTVSLEGGRGDSNLQTESGYRRSSWRLSAARAF